MFEGLRSRVLILSTHWSLILAHNFGQPSCLPPADVTVSIEQVSQGAVTSQRLPQERSMKQVAWQWAKLQIGK